MTVIGVLYNFSDVRFSLENNTRQKIKNNIIVANVIEVNGSPKVLKGERHDGYTATWNVSDGSTVYGYRAPMYYHLKKIGELDFWQEISGFFHAREKVYIQEGCEELATEIVPEDITKISGLSVAAGDYVVDKDLNVYRIYGWDNQNNSDYYWDFLDGQDSLPLTRLNDGTISNRWVRIEMDKLGI
jgi:hypothetical protein